MAHLGMLVAALALDAAVQVGCCRFLPRVGWLWTVLAGFGAGLAGLVALEALLAPRLGQEPADLWGNLLAVGGTYAAAGFFYFNVINGRKTALRVRLLRELEAAPGGLTAADLLERYPPAAMIETRVERMRGYGQMVERDGRWHATRGPLWMIMRIMFALQRLVMGRRGGARR